MRLPREFVAHVEARDELADDVRVDESWWRSVQPPAGIVLTPRAVAAPTCSRPQDRGSDERKHEHSKGRGPASAARAYDPIVRGEAGEDLSGYFLKDYARSHW